MLCRMKSWLYDVQTVGILDVLHEEEKTRIYRNLLDNFKINKANGGGGDGGGEGDIGGEVTVTYLEQREAA